MLHFAGKKLLFPQKSKGFAIINSWQSWPNQLVDLCEAVSVISFEVGQKFQPRRPERKADDIRLGIPTYHPDVGPTFPAKIYCETCCVRCSALDSRGREAARPLSTLSRKCTKLGFLCRSQFIKEPLMHVSTIGPMPCPRGKTGLVSLKCKQTNKIYGWMAVQFKMKPKCIARINQCRDFEKQFSTGSGISTELTQLFSSE